MILERLVLENFRQFKGRQELVFSDLRERNVTIVHAENGFGKTTSNSRCSRNFSIISVLYMRSR